jgi:diaminopimelate decarboxylase
MQPEVIFDYNEPSDSLDKKSATDMSIPIDKIYQHINSSKDSVCAYFYDLDELKNNAQRIVKELPKQIQLYYAIKANSDSEILSGLSPYIQGYEVASAGEVVKVRQQKTGKPIAFGGPGKTIKELSTALDHNVELYHIESRLQLERLNDLASKRDKRVSILLRVNPRFSTPKATIKMGGEATQFGIDQFDIPELIKLTLTLPAITLVGFHFHAISNNLDAKTHLELISKYIHCIKTWKEEYNLNLTTLNFGGGIGINYQELNKQFNWSLFCKELEVLLNENDIREDVIFECGRFLTATCGYYACEITDIKTVQNKNFAILRGGSHHFRLPSSWQHNHPFVILPSINWHGPYTRPTIKNEKISLCGELCTPKDTLAKDVWVESLQAGDHIVFLLAGAYGWHISHHDFLSHDHPSKVFIEETLIE